MQKAGSLDAAHMVHAQDTHMICAWFENNFQFAFFFLTSYRFGQTGLTK